MPVRFSTNTFALAGSIFISVVVFLSSPDMLEYTEYELGGVGGRE